MNILLIGHEGYLGSGLFQYFVARHRVIGWGRKQDICNLGPAVLSHYQIDVVVNCGAVMDRTGTVYAAGSESERVNVLGLRQLVSALTGRDIPLIHISTKDVFGNVYGPQDVEERADCYLPKFLVDENRSFAPATVYAKTKLMGEFIAEGHARSAVIRLSTCYSDFDHPRGNWLVKMIKADLAGSPIVVTNTGKQFRDMLHVVDLGRLIEQIVAKNIYGIKINAGGGMPNTLSLLQVIQLINPMAKIKFSGKGDYGFAFDNRRAFELAGWQPQILFQDRVERIKKNINDHRMISLDPKGPPRQAVLLAAGRGTRLGELTQACPKPMLEICGKPLILHNLEMCRRAGVSRLFINLHHCHEKLVNFLGDGSSRGVNITYAYEASLLGTAGALNNFRRSLAEGAFYVIYADNYSGYDLKSIWAQHARSRADMSIAVFQADEPRYSGVVVMDGDHWIIKFVEKPREAVESRWVNAGIYIMEPGLLPEIPEDECDFGQDLIPEFIAAGKRILGVKMEQRVMAIDTPELFARTKAEYVKKTSCPR